MADRDRIEQLNDALAGAMLPGNSEIRELLVIARRLRPLPSEDFRTRLKAELQEKAITAKEVMTPTLMPYLVAQAPAHLLHLITQPSPSHAMQLHTTPH